MCVCVCVCACVCVLVYSLSVECCFVCKHLQGELSFAERQLGEKEQRIAELEESLSGTSLLVRLFTVHKVCI